MLKLHKNGCLFLHYKNVTSPLFVHSANFVTYLCVSKSLGEYSLAIAQNNKKKKICDVGIVRTQASRITNLQFAFSIDRTQRYFSSCCVRCGDSLIPKLRFCAELLTALFLFLLNQHPFQKR